jgi:hypothetical protein
MCRRRKSHLYWQVAQVDYLDDLIIELGATETTDTLRRMSITTSLSL